jgi:hypothetical protein
MKKKLLIFILFCSLCSYCKAQKQIVYNFDSSVVDSMRSGIEVYSRLLKKPIKSLRICAVIVECNNQFEIFLQEYSHLTKGGFLDLIRSTNRKLIFNKELTIPIIIPADKLSMQIQKAHIELIPLYGYYLKIVYENYKQKVVQTAMTF